MASCWKAILTCQLLSLSLPIIAVPIMQESTVPPTVIPIMRHENKNVQVDSSISRDIAASGRLSRKMQTMASTLPNGVTKNLLQSFKICTSCKQFNRLGEAHDGGYLTCMDSLTDGHVKAAYSMGVEQHDKWSDDVYKLLKVPVNQFDCTVSGPANKCPTCHFYKACLKAPDGGGAITGKTSWTMAEALQKSGQQYSKSRSLLMKMDIEGAEWPILAAGGDIFKKFDQLIFEFHWLNNETAHAQYYKAMSNLQTNGFRVAHIHGNNNAGMYTKGGYSIPNVIEVTLLSQNPALATCKGQDYSPLNSTNIPANPELPNAKLPS